MPFQSRIFTLPKDTEHPEENQDAGTLDPVRGIAVVADGVASAIFSGQWATILAEATLADTPQPDDKEAFAHWLALRRQTWTRQIDVTGLAWFQKAKLPLGAFSTLLCVRTAPMDQQQEGAFGAYRLQCFAIGDSCLFHVRGGELVRTFPIQNAAELESDPVVLGSVDLGRDGIMEFSHLDELCYPDDVLVLCTDAVAEWALRQIEAASPPDWLRYWDLTEKQWQEEVIDLRNRREMRYDDATLLLLKIVAEGVELAQPETQSLSTPASTAHCRDQAVTSTEEPVVAEVVEPEYPTPPPPNTLDGGDEASAEDDWKEKFKSAGEQVAEGVELASEQVMRGLKKWKEKAVEKYRDKFDK